LNSQFQWTCFPQRIYVKLPNDIKLTGYFQTEAGLKPTLGELMIKETNKWICALAYIIFFIPLLVDRDNRDYIFHTNQGLNLFLFSVAITTVGIIVPALGWFLILPIGTLYCFVLTIIGIINAVNHINKELPLVGRYRLIKQRNYSENQTNSNEDY